MIVRCGRCRWYEFNARQPDGVGQCFEPSAPWSKATPLQAPCPNTGRKCASFTDRDGPYPRPPATGKTTGWPDP